MKAVLDACVLVPPVVRECLLGAARAGMFRPFWSARIVAEWQHAAARHGAGSAVEAAEALRIAAQAFPAAMVPPAPGLEARLHLPDQDDIHVLATAVAAGADAIVTWNAADFPRGVLAAEGIARRDPDGLLWEFWSGSPAIMDAVLETVRAEAERRASAPVALPALLKRARLTRLSRALR
ncbi:MAG: PIN domain-containing protein [Paracoccaceae bacterium]|nr:MAG: PIN domain-containing protein [Paracoccaceae bacterium]